MFLNTITSFWLAGIIMLFWLRIISATDKGVLSWPFLPIENLVGNDYNRNIQFFVGIFLWLIISIPFGFVYWLLVENSFLTYYDLGSVVFLTSFLAIISLLITLPLTKCGWFGQKLSSYVWLESLLGWVVFGLIFYMLIKIV